MIDLVNVSYNKVEGVITAVALFDKCKYRLSINVDTWEVFCDDKTVPNTVVGKTRNKFKEMILSGEEIPSMVQIVWC